MKKNKMLLKTFIASLVIVGSFSSYNAFAAPDDQPIGERSKYEEKRAEEKLKAVKERLNKKEQKSISPRVNPDIPPSKVLSTSGYIRQPDGSTCGPTSAHNLLVSWGKNVSIDTLKRDLGYSGQTPFGDAWPQTLNKHSGSSYYTISWGPSQSDIWSAAVGTALDDNPLIYDVHMNSSNGYLVGYSGSSWWHYVTGVGYSGYYNATKYLQYFDPYDGRPSTYGLQKLSLEKWAPLLRERGMVW